MINESLIAETYKNKQKMGNWACFKPFNYKEIEAIRKIKESLSFNNGTISTSDNKLGINEDYRTTKVSWIYQQPEYKWLYEKVMFKMVEANSHMWNLDVFGYYEAFQYAIYTQGSHYDWHIDTGPGKFVRKISASLQLSDGSEYVGGDLIIKNGRDEIPVDRTRGSLIVFPSTSLHKVTPIVSGQRESLVIWLSGPPWR
tara:strand:+ start:3365 stop:3961 length:597 start_codon:yes stop_codon:yes gene_type:complete